MATHRDLPEPLLAVARTDYTAGRSDCQIVDGFKCLFRGGRRCAGKSEREAGTGDREPHFAPPETGAAMRSSTLSWSWIICRSLLSAGLTRRGFWVIACADSSALNRRKSRSSRLAFSLSPRPR